MAEGSNGELDVVVIGAGFAGIYALHKLRNELGLNVRAFDNASGVGGTWYWNRYPGVRCDTEITAYCYSFDRALWHEWKWHERYPRQPEILAYLNHVVDRYDLRRSITFGATVQERPLQRARPTAGTSSPVVASTCRPSSWSLASGCCRRATTRTSRAGRRSTARRTTRRRGPTRASTCAASGSPSSGPDRAGCSASPRSRRRCASSTCSSGDRSTTCPPATRPFPATTSRPSTPGTTSTGRASCTR